MAARRLAAARLPVAGGADANAIDARGWPLLIDAADRGDAGIIQALFGGGALGKTPTGVTALSAAVLKRHTSVIRPLLAAGAHVRDPAGETPILLAAKFEGMVTVVPPGGVVAGTPGPPPGPRIVFSPMSATGAASVEVTRNTEPELVALLLKAGADPNSADRAGRTPLMFAAAQGRVELVQSCWRAGRMSRSRPPMGRRPGRWRRGRKSGGCCGRPGGGGEIRSDIRRQGLVERRPVVGMRR